MSNDSFARSYKDSLMLLALLSYSLETPKSVSSYFNVEWLIYFSDSFKLLFCDSYITFLETR